jgi:Bacterial protein of unknown function (DUF839)
MARHFRRTAVLGLTLFTGAALVPGAASAVPLSIGPSTLAAPYVQPVAAGAEITSVFTVADPLAADNGYEMTGIPDGLGAFRSGDNKMVVYMNQELGQTQGTVRRHGQAGAFVTRLVINSNNLRVKQGRDFINPGVKYWDYFNGKYASAPDAYIAGSGADLPAFGRFCSGHLTDKGQLFNPQTGRGYKDRLYFANEENGQEGRVFAVTPSGEAWQLPRLGLFSWENTLAADNSSDTTVIMGNEDQSNITPGVNESQMWVYVGTKQKQGSEVDKAGLTNGINYVVRVGDGALDDAGVRAAIASDPDGRVPFDLSEVEWNESGADQNLEAREDGLSLNRIEDGEFDPLDPNVFYFLTTEGSPANPPETPARDGGGLWRMTFDDIDDPLAGGELELLLDGTESIYSAVGGESKMNKPDNMTIDRHGNLLIQEDPGGNAHLARIVAYRIDDGALGVVARFDPLLFSGAAPLTIDEESSGIIDTQSLMGAGTFLFDAQVHTSAGLNSPATQVERGQLLKLRVTDWASVYSPGA